MSRAVLYAGNALDVLKTLDAESVQCCVTSPPYWGLRDYGHAGQLGLERTPEEYIENLVDVFREVRRVLKNDGTLWLNLGDKYAMDDKWGGQSGGLNITSVDGGFPRQRNRTGLKPKDLVGIPWRVAFALRADGWWLRSDIIWSKPNPMPESVRDRPTKAHEYVFLFSKSAKYFYDADAIAEEPTTRNLPTWEQRKAAGEPMRHGRAGAAAVGCTRVGVGEAGRNARTVWEIATKAYPGAHFATFPPELAERCVKAGSVPGDTVLDPFGGSGTTAAVATGHGRNAIHIDLIYHDLAIQRIGPMLCEVRKAA